MLKSVVLIMCVLMLTACITPHQELNGQWTKPAKVEERSAMGTNHGFARLERCDGPEKKKAWYQFYYESDFEKCVYLTKAEQDEWEGDQSRGAGPEIIQGVVIGGTVGVIAATNRAKAAAGATATATNTAVQSVTTGKHRR